MGEAVGPVLADLPGKRTFRTDLGELPQEAPAWLPPMLEEFRANVGDVGYPCHFGRHALRLGELFGTWVEADEDLTVLRDDLAAFLDATRPYPGRRMVMAAFFAPASADVGHEEYGRRFWSVLQFLHDQDDRAWPGEIPVAPDDSRWEFSFHGVPMFVFAAAPSHTARRSRCLGPGLVLLFQPRNVFAGIEGGTRAGVAARRRIRERQETWDTVGPHPLMGDYGDPSNFEWTQYYVADDDSAMYHGGCPLDTSVEAEASQPAAEARLCMHRLFEQQAARTPFSVAVIAGDESLDYRTLDRRANRLAHALVAEGVRPEDRVGVMADRSADTVVAILGVLKAGAAYLPIDPEHPEDRRVLMLEESGVDVVVAPGRLLSSIPVGPRRLVAVDGTGELPVTPPATGVRPDNLAYVIYTSGSTGAPKGVMATHRHLVAATLAQSALDRPWPEAFLMPISFSFDASCVGLYWTLTSGGCLVIPTDGEHRDPTRLRELAERYGTTHSDCTPALYDLILGTDPKPLRTMRCVMVGGEACPPALAARHRELLPGCLLENNYGPTEVAVWAAAHLVRDDGDFSEEAVPIGRAVSCTSAHVLDSTLTPVAPGEPGELFLGGENVTRGYQLRPGLTAERFLPDPFTDRPGARMYRTGDVVRSRPDGAMEFRGRTDAQVKVRGHRVELGELEVALRRHPDVAEAVADLRTVAGEPVLVAYLRLAQGRDCTDTALRAHLSPILPPALMPSRFVRVAAMPWRPNGKIDRSALPAPVAEGER